MPQNPLGPICKAATIHFAASVANFARLETRPSPGELYHGFDTRLSPPSREALQDIGSATVAGTLRHMGM